MPQIKPNWRPSPATLEWVAKEIKKVGVAVDPDFELDFFRDYYAARGASFADWDAAYRNWIRRSISDATKSAKNTPKAVKEAQEYADIPRLDDRPLGPDVPDVPEPSS